MPIDELNDKITIGNSYGERSCNNAPLKAYPFLQTLMTRLTERSIEGSSEQLEAWASEAYGAAYTLQELLTRKPLAPEERSKIYEAIVKGELPDDLELPESFNVLVRELQALCQDADLRKSKASLK
jgi:hypothetical protein